MLFLSLDRERRQITLILDETDCDDLALACLHGVTLASDPEYILHDVHTAERLRLFNVVFMVACEALHALKQAPTGNGHSR